MPIRFVTILFLFASLTVAGGVQAQLPAVYGSQLYGVKVEEVAGGLQHPWSLVFLPGGDVLVSERAGRLRLIRDGVLLPEPVSGVPAVAAMGQGGLLDLALHPDFDSNHFLYFSYAAQVSGGLTTRVARARLVDDALVDFELIFEAQPASSGGRHFGSRLAFDGEGYLYITVGDRGQMERAQLTDDHAGSVIRLHDDGRVPVSNPFVGRADVRDELYTIGNRNPQGLFYDAVQDRLWSSEHGPRGGDEINLILAGRNYGWPEVTHGIDYSGLRISRHQALPGMESPLWHWTPSIAPSGLLLYRGQEFPAWQGQLLSGALRDRLISRLSVDETDTGLRVQEEERFLQPMGKRIRDLREAADGSIWILTDENPGQILRLTRQR